MLSPEERKHSFDSVIEPIAHWPERIIELANVWTSGSNVNRDKVLGDMWQLLNMALMRYLRVHRKRFDYGDDEDLRDIASQKSLELFNQIDRRKWRPAEHSPAQLSSFVSILARNGLIDHLRVIGSKRPRRDAPLPDQPLGSNGNSRHADHDAVNVVQPDGRVDRDEFVRAIKDCAQHMQPRARTVWFLRVLLGMPAKQIARHPAVDMKPGTIDVTLSRCRDAVRRCMETKGFQPDDMPPGTFVALWETFDNDLRALLRT